MIKLLNLNSSFLDKKYNYINKFLKEKNLINKTLKEFNLKKPTLISSLKRDPGLIDPYFLHPVSNEAFIKYINELENKLLMINGTLSKRIDIKPNIKFEQNKKKLSLNILDEIPASNLKIYFINDVPEWIALDENYNGKVDDNEVKYFSKGQNFIELNVDLYANRIIYSKNKNLELLK